ncbi:MAG TPA: trypsin-like peptidase domain-containing protein [Candidatus Saccharimonadales bacterium]|jgi:S1-C subfamily serine protease|nr:trypsin-like peptidase domain-containing protein [Candidatus Saccharimonadales bacterium]
MILEKNNGKKQKTGSFQVVSIHNQKIDDFRSRISRSKQIKDLKKLNNKFVYILCVLVISFGAGYAGAILQYRHQNLVTSQVKEIVNSTKGQLTSVIASSVSPSVVSIDAIETATTTDVFGLQQSSQEESEGTGIILSNTGYIVTNRHVVPSGTTSVSVILSDGTELNNVSIVGETNGSDSLDIAILKINNPPTGLQPALLGNSNNVSIGDSVVAIGNALGEFQNTVTSGIISGRGRSIQAGNSSNSIVSTDTTETLQDMIQTDAAINSGNSGGPLVNDNGEVIGVNTAVASDGAQNIGFAIPINDIKGIIKGVLNSGKFERPYIGVYYIPIDPSVSKQYNLSVSTGAYIPTSSQNQNQSPIVANSPASQAGLQGGDVIEAVNGVLINQNTSLVSLVDVNSAGTTVNLSVLRDGAVKNIPITIGSQS